MAGIFERIALMFKTKAHKTLDKYEDPRETLDYSYERQLELLRKVRRGVADVATSRKRVELQAQKMSSEIDRYTVTAQRALESNREDLAREALTRKAGLTTQLQDLQNQHSALQAEEEKLVRASTRLQAKVDAFRTRKETIKATYSARASAVDELLASGALEDATGSVGSDLDRELDALASGSSVENELAAMKAQLSGGSATTHSQISSAPATSSMPMIENTRTANTEGQA